MKHKVKPMVYHCTICGDEIRGTSIGDGDGTGQRFAHAACYWLRDMILEALPWCPESIRRRVLRTAEWNRLDVRSFEQYLRDALKR